MNKYHATFDELKVGVEFTRCGTTYIKQSTRTAVIIKPVRHSGWWFYFGNKDNCVVNNLNKLNLRVNIK